MRPETCYGTESNRATSSGCGPRRRHTTVRGCGIPAAVADTSRRCPGCLRAPRPPGARPRIARREPQVPRGSEDEAALTADLAELVRQCGAVLVCGSRQSDGLHRTEFPVAERLRRELQRKTAGRASERRGLRRTEGGTDHHRELAPTLRHDASTGRARLQAAGLGGLRASIDRLAGCACPTTFAGQATRGAEANPARIWNLDHRVGADHGRRFRGG
jgi:hypothetical protein